MSNTRMNARYLTPRFYPVQCQKSSPIRPSRDVRLPVNLQPVLPLGDDLLDPLLRCLKFSGDTLGVETTPPEH